MHAIICIFDFMNLMLFVTKFVKFKPIGPNKVEKVRTSQQWYEIYRLRWQHSYGENVYTQIISDDKNEKM